MKIRRRRREPMPAREAELCERFAAAARHQGWEPYPEVGGWDLVLVWRGEPTRFLRTGDQIGVEAKLRAGVEVLAQVLQRGRYQGPDFRAVLVPKASKDFRFLARELRVPIYDLRDCAIRRRASWGDWPVIQPADGLRWEPKRRLWLPPVPLQAPGGQPAPRRLTSWRVAALRLCTLIRDRGFLTSADFTREKIAISTWRDRWIKPDYAAPREGRLLRYVPIPGRGLPDAGYEAERDALATA